MSGMHLKKQTVVIFSFGAVLLDAATCDGLQHVNLMLGK